MIAGNLVAVNNVIQKKLKGRSNAVSNFYKNGRNPFFW